MSERLDGRYVLLERLGRGGMAEVWRARDARAGTTVAVKRLHPHLRSDDAALERFRREASSAAAVQHPRAVGVRAVRIDTDEAYLVMDLVPGGSLADRLKRAGPLPVALAVRTAAEVAQVLGEAHRRGIVHRDVTPTNILLDPDAGARLVDFGIARALEDAVSVTATGDVVGTLRYVAPEVLAGAPPTPASDVWSLGAVLYEAVAGRPPFAAAAPVAVLEARSSVPPPIAGQPDQLNALLARMLEPSPDKRPADGAAADAALQAVARALASRPASPDDETVVMPAVTAPMPPAESPDVAPSDPAPGRPTRAVPAVLLAGAALLIGLAVVGAGPLEGLGPGASGPAIATTPQPAVVPAATQPPAEDDGGVDSEDKASSKGKGENKGKGKGRGKDD